jgi:uncharacterized phage protein (TIGR01671 family)
MRKIKFRAWDGERLKPVNLWGFSEGFIMTSKYSADEEEFKVMQYTGLKDKDGKGIYEGDIVEITGHPFDDSIPVNGRYEVGYNEYMELCCGSWLLFRMKSYCEVIGNKYENPELLNS